jgi:hypothetical protein
VNCSEVRASLPELLYGQLEPAEKSHAEQHLASCSACRAEREALQHLHRLLDAPVAPTVQVDLPELYRRAAAEQTRLARRWRRTAQAVCGAAAALVIVAVGLRLELRLEAHQVVVRWGAPPPLVPTPPVSAPAGSDPPSQSLLAHAEEVRLLRELIHALAADVDGRDRRQQEELTRLQGRLQELQRQVNRRLLDPERHLTAVPTARSLPSLKGEDE